MSVKTRDRTIMISLLTRLFVYPQISVHCKLFLCSHSPNDVFPEHQRNVSIAAVRGAVRPSKCVYIAIIYSIHTYCTVRQCWPICSKFGAWSVFCVHCNHLLYTYILHGPAMLADLIKVWCVVCIQPLKKHLTSY